MSTAFRALVRKDILLFLTDRRALLMSFAVPIVIASFFGYVLGGSNREDAARIAVLIADEDGSAVSKQIVSRLTGENALDVKPAGAAMARESVRKGNTAVAVVIPKGFGQDSGKAFFGDGAKPSLGVLYDPSRSAERAMVQGMLTGDVMQVVSKEMFSGTTGRDLVKDALKQVQGSTSMAPLQKKTLVDLLRGVAEYNDSYTGSAASPPGLAIPFTTRDEAVTARQNVAYNGYGHAFAGMTVQFVLFLAIDVGIGLLLQRQRGLWKRFRAAPLSRGLLLGSRAVSAAILAFVVLQVNFLFSRIVFGVRIDGSMAGFFAVGAAFALMTASFGLLIASLGKTPEATRGLAIFVTLIVVMLGGAWMPSFLFPQWLLKLTVVVPTRWAIDGLEAMTWRGLGFSAALVPVGVLLAFAIVFGALAVSRFQWEAEG